MNKVVFSFANLKKVNKDFQPLEKESTVLIMSCDSLQTNLGPINSVEQARSMIDPSRIEKVLENSLSEDEYEIFAPLLPEGGEYYFYDEVFKMPIHKNNK